MAQMGIVPLQVPSLKCARYRAHVQARLNACTLSLHAAAYHDRPCMHVEDLLSQ